MHTIELNSHNKTDRYQQLLPQLAALIEDETDLTANLANVCAALKDSFGWLWVGFYRADSHTRSLPSLGWSWRGLASSMRSILL